MNDSAASSASAAPAYRVLARKHRPGSFDQLIGQDVLVRTLTNALTSGRTAQAYILTGIRGVGKTTTARIMARAFNCAQGPTATPCGVCEACVAIADDRHVDVLEMDAASRTGVDDIRELTDNVHYRPASARYRVYILDEVHMLSKQAFNALLKTLEEPPEHAKFIFATTEIRKVPPTVLSRCQRFDLLRVPIQTLVDHYSRILQQESVPCEEEALRMIARAADGSVRDGLSLLDQAIALCSGAQVTAAQVQNMLGLADQTRVFDLFEAVMRGQAVEALTALRALYDAGVDPVMAIQDLLAFCYDVTRLKLVPDLLEQPETPELIRTRGQALAENLSLPVLARAWQMLLKGLEETRHAPAPIQAAEMVLTRLLCVAPLPDPASLMKILQQHQLGERAPAPAGREQPVRAAALAEGKGESVANSPPATQIQPISPQSFEQVVALFRERREAILLHHLEHDAHLVSFAPGRIVLRPKLNAPPDLVRLVAGKLSVWTGAPWTVTASEAEGSETLAAQRQADNAARRQAVMQDPLVQSVQSVFPGARVVAPEADGTPS